MDRETLYNLPKGTEVLVRGKLQEMVPEEIATGGFTNLKGRYWIRIHEGVLAVDPSQIVGYKAPSAEYAVVDGASDEFGEDAAHND